MGDEKVGRPSCFFREGAMWEMNGERGVLGTSIACSMAEIDWATAMVHLALSPLEGRDDGGDSSGKSKDCA